MATHKITDKVMAKVGRMFSGPDKERTIKSLESGKTVYISGQKFRGVKVDKADITAPATPAADTKKSDPAKAVKDK